MLFIVITIIILLYIIIYNNVKITEKFDNSIGNIRFGYVINLDSRTDRLNAIIKKFESHNLPLYRIPAIKNVIGWKGCAYSHLSVIKMAKISNLPSILILEDDCKPNINFKQWFVIQDWLEKHRDDWDIFTGGNSYYGFNSNDKKSIKPICNLKNSIKLYYTKLTALHFYYVNSSAYDKMLEYEEYLNKNPTEWVPVDFWPDRKELKIITCSPFLAIQEVDYSDIEKVEKNLNAMYETSESLIKTVDNETICEPFQNFTIKAYSGI